MYSRANTDGSGTGVIVRLAATPPPTNVLSPVTNAVGWFGIESFTGVNA